MKCDIIIPVWNQLEVSKACIENLIKNTDYPYRLILVDNGSDADTKRYLETVSNDKYLDVKLISNEENLGFVKAVNQGLRISDAPYVCILNNDTVATPGWLKRLVEFAETHQDVGLMNPLCNGPHDVPIEEYAKILENNKGKYMEMNQCLLFCALIKREVIDKIGYLDEIFGMGCYDDTDYSMRAGKAGYRCVSVHSACVYHKHGISFKALGKKKIFAAKGEEAYFKKWPRHLRIGIGFSIDGNTRDLEIENLLRAILFLAREWCWINFWIFGQKDKDKGRIAYISEKIKLPLHQNIKFNYLSKRFKNMKLLTRLLERSFGTKRRKKYDSLLVDDEKTFSFLKGLHPLHNVKVHLIDPRIDSIENLHQLIAKLRSIE